jgi:hypothetical protein
MKPIQGYTLIKPDDLHSYYSGRGFRGWLRV